jgi:predicted GTPase
MEVATRAIAAGAAFRLAGARETMLAARVPVVAVCAVRTGCGKSQTTRFVSRLLQGAGRRVVVIRHPMPYGDLAKQRVQRFAEPADLDRHKCTIEEREEYEPHVAAGNLVFAGCDYEAILREAEKEADVIVWDGGNNDFPFYLPALEIVVADPHRVGHELTYYPGRINLARAGVVVINKVDSAPDRDVARLRENVRGVNPDALIIEAESPLALSDSEAVRGKRVLVVEDGPTLTHGGMAFGAGTLAAKAGGAASLVDPRPFAKGGIAGVFAKYPHLTDLLPAVGYGEAQIRDLEATINATDCDLVVVGTPIDLRRLLRLNKPAVRVTYELRERTAPGLADALRVSGLLGVP